VHAGSVVAAAFAAATRWASVGPDAGCGGAETGAGDAEAEAGDAEAEAGAAVPADDPSPPPPPHPASSPPATATADISAAHRASARASSVEDLDTGFASNAAGQRDSDSDMVISGFSWDDGDVRAAPPPARLRRMTNRDGGVTPSPSE
jgi:hypothetical protein